MKKIYVTGVSGTGKTTLVNEFKSMGIFALDLDSISRWEHRETGEHHRFYHGIGKDWLDSHGWICNLEKLKEIFKEHESENIFVFGVIDNEKEALPLFDKVFLLQCSEEVAFKRIENRTENDFGKHPTEKEWILSWQKDFESRLLSNGAISINTENDIKVVADSILSHI